MIRPDPAALSLGRASRLALRLTPRGGRAGEMRGSGLGSSVEFQDRRAFLPGDDLRRLDWRALARTDRMLLRQHREEVTPVLELVVDCSRSMAVEAEKAQLTVDLAALLVEAARGESWRVRLTLAEGGELRSGSVEALLAEGLGFEGRGPLSDAGRALAGRLAPGSLTLVISDLLFPGEPAVLINPIAARVGRPGLIQVLGPRELDPPQGSFRLQDAERGEAIERSIDDAAIRAYRARLERHNEGWRQACVSVGAAFVSLSAGRPLATLVRAELLDAGFLVPALMAGSGTAG